MEHQGLVNASLMPDLPGRYITADNSHQAKTRLCFAGLP